MEVGAAQIGDKIQVKSGHPKNGLRGEITRVQGETCFLRLENGNRVKAEVRQLRNYSSAARKAWEAMPSRQVGRPKGTKKSDRVSVTLRFDRAMWDKFLHLERIGTVSDRTEVFHQALSQIVESRSKTHA